MKTFFMGLLLITPFMLGTPARAADEQQTASNCFETTKALSVLEGMHMKLVWKGNPDNAENNYIVVYQAQNNDWIMYLTGFDKNYKIDVMCMLKTGTNSLTPR